MTTIRYTYEHKDQNTFGNDKIPTTTLPPSDNVGHSDHWAIVSDDTEKLTAWFRQSLDNSVVPTGLDSVKTCDEFLLIADNNPTHIQQIFRLDDGKPVALVNAYPTVNSPYGLDCTIDEIIACDNQDAILKLRTTDGTQIFAFDKLYAINQCHYQKNQTYYVNFSAWAYHLQKSDENEIIKVEDPDAIRYHRAFNDIVAKNNGQIPDDLDKQIANWQPDTNEPLAPVEINLGHSCIYLFGETLGQQDEAWCQGQILGKSETNFFDQAITLFDVVILREMNAKPFVVRIATPTTPTTNALAVHDYIKANIWLQAGVYGANNVGK